ncbi:MAG: TadE/TadG family type IV pilus assembly protein [Pseudomonadota bacterium]
MDEMLSNSDRLGIGKVIDRLKDLPEAKSGAAAIEFALIAPFMILLWLGATELTLAMSADRKMSHASSVLADLVTQQNNVTNVELEDIMDAAESIMLPHDVDDLSIHIVGVKIDEDGNPTVEWSKARNGSAATSGEAFNIPSSLRIANSFLVAAELAFRYEPPTVHVVTGPITLNDTFYLRPRQSDEVTCNPCS